MSKGVAHNKRIVEVESTGFDRVIDIFNEDNEFSVLSLLPSNATYLRDKIKNLDVEYRDQDQFTIRNLVKPTPTLNQLRLNFWTEYDRTLGATVTGKFSKLNIANVTKGVCSLPLFKAFCADELNLAWILTPVQSYQSQCQDVMETALYKLRQGIENMDMTDVKELNTVIKIFEGFDKRVHGEYKKTIEVKKTSVIEDNSGIKDKMVDLGIQNDVVVDYDGE